MLRRGFTLIELLIVVAIIAILAAIAVPNFLEAQVRSKISRGKADMRSLMLAEESYRIDNNKYTPDNIPDKAGKVMADMTSWVCLTTPVAFMSSIPQSPFREFKNIHNGYGKTVSSGSTDGNDGNYYEYWYGGFSGGRFVPTATSAAAGIWWRASSNGPDNLSDFHGQYLTSSSLDPMDIKNRNPKFVNCIYDPTNGTTSRGDIFITNVGFVQ